MTFYEFIVLISSKNALVYAGLHLLFSFHPLRGEDYDGDASFIIAPNSIHSAILNRLYVIVRLDRTIQCFMDSPIKSGNDCAYPRYIL